MVFTGRITADVFIPGVEASACPECHGFFQSEQPVNDQTPDLLQSRAVEAVVFGVVQGVGFRPFIYRLARKYGYKGWVKNIERGVKIHLETRERPEFSDFFRRLDQDAPPLALIETVELTPARFFGCTDFKIERTRQGQGFVFISPDIAVCKNCLREMNSPHDRRSGYPFINCTDCGPRYTIVSDLPYDRPKTTMSEFQMCEDCRREYTDPLNRRYHAQPIACPACGPRVFLLDSKTHREINGGINKAVSLIQNGRILAVKGLGGFHLVCDAFNPRAVARLRRIKRRASKPLALMAKSTEVIQRYARVRKAERSLLLSARRPIVLLKKKKDIQGIAPHLDEMGFMLPYTPLHELLLANSELIVATSSNQKDAPIMKDEEEGIFTLCDAVLTHDRPIAMRADDSVLRVVGRQPQFIRRARGYVPYPQKVPQALASSHHILALGGELKDTISVYKNGYVVTSQFLGDLDEYQNYDYFEETLEHLKRLFSVKPDAIVSDLHPCFHTTRFAQKMALPHIQVQHHFAHVLAALLEHQVPPDQRVLGVSFDGFGYGEDGLAWGAEFLLADYSGYKRLAHFKYVPLPGGDLASKQPWRMGLVYLLDAFGVKYPRLKAFEKISAQKILVVSEMIKRGINTPLASSCGRLFDAVSFLVGLSPEEIEFEAEAPMRLEAASAEGIRSRYPYDLLPPDQDINPVRVSFSRLIRALCADLARQVSTAVISAKFHNSLAHLIGTLSLCAREKHGIDTVILSGGVFLNKRLLRIASRLLDRKGFHVLRPVEYSPNDESLSVGQIAYALNRIKAGRF